MPSAQGLVTWLPLGPKWWTPVLVNCTTTTQDDRLVESERLIIYIVVVLTGDHKCLDGGDIRKIVYII